MNKRIGILGCGWLGKPLALQLIAQGYAVRGTTTRAEKKAELASFGIDTHIIRVEETGFKGDIIGFLNGLDVLIFNIPPGLRQNPEANYVQKIEHLLVALRKTAVPRLIYISSTSVYGRLQGRVDESTLPLPDSKSGKQLLEAEQRIWGDRISRSTLIIRLGGLIGPNRHPVFTLSGKTELTHGEDPVNLIQQDEAIRIIEWVLERTTWEGLLNAVHPDHPRKSEFYTKEALRLGLTPPGYITQARADTPKQVLSRFAPELISVFSKHL